MELGLCRNCGSRRSNQFLAARTTQGMPPNQETIFLGSSGDAKSKALAALLHSPPVLGNRVEMSLGLIEVKGASGSAGTFFAAQPCLLAKGQGASATAAVLATPDFAARSAVQVHDLTVRAYTGGALVRQDFPFRLTRPSGERYVNQLNARKELAIEIQPGRELDGGGLLDRMEYDASVSGFRLKIGIGCCGIKALASKMTGSRVHLNSPRCFDKVFHTQEWELRRDPAFQGGRAS